jgi:hypothetical protein
MDRIILERILEKAESMNVRLKVLASNINRLEREDKERWQRLFNEIAEVDATLKRMADVLGSE